MALTIDPETGIVTTTFLLEQRRIDREVAASVAAINRGVIADAVKWRMLPERVRHHYEREYARK